MARSKKKKVFSLPQKQVKKIIEDIAVATKDFRRKNREEQERARRANQNRRLGPC